MAKRSKTARGAFYTISFLFWLAAVCAALELYAGHGLRSIETKNPFILQYDQSLIWPNLDDNLRPIPFAPLPAINESAMRPKDENDHLGAFFAALSEEDRNTFAALREIAVIVLEADGAKTRIYGEEHAKSAGVDLNELNYLAPLQQILSTGKTLTEHRTLQKTGAPLTVELECYPMKDPVGRVAAAMCTVRALTGITLTEEQSRKAIYENHPMWKTPFFEYRKNVPGTRWYTNNFGFRDNPVATPKPAGVYRVACIGGSTTDEGYTNDITYPKILERSIRAALPDRQIEVLNCGVIGLDSLLEKRRALDYVQLQPDLVIEYGAVNDICHAMLPMWAKDAKAWQKLLRRSRFLCQHFNARFWPPEEEMRAQIRRSVIQNLKAVADVMKKHNIKMAVSSFAAPDPALLTRDEYDYFNWNVRTFWQGLYTTYTTYHHLVNLYNEELKTFCEQNALLYIPLAENLHGNIRLFGDICHMRPAGIEKKAEFLSNWLQDYLKQ